MDVNVKLKFDGAKDLKMLADLLWKIDCPMKDVKCIACRYHRSCLKLRDIGRTLESVVLYEE